MGLFRFFNTQSLLKQEKYPAARLSVSVLVFLVLAVSILVLVMFWKYTNQDLALYSDISYCVVRKFIKSLSVQLIYCRLSSSRADL